MLSAFKAWLHWGVERESSYTLKRKLLQCNAGALLTIAAMLCFDLVFLLIGNASLLKISFIHLPFYLSLALIPWLNRHGWVELARVNLGISTMINQLLTLIWVWGSNYGAQYFFIMFAMVPITFYPIRQWRAAMAWFGLSMGIYLYFEINNVAPDPGLLALSDLTAHFLRYLFVVSTLACLLLFVWMVEMVAERSEDQLEKLAVTDALTDLPNRRFFELVMQREFAKGLREKTPLTLAMLDIDHFKRVNDNYGHDVGDAVLKHVAQQMRHATRGGNLLARMGGEEFAVLLPGITAAEAVEIAQRIRLAVEEHIFHCQGRALPLTVSIGVASANDGLSIDQCLKNADEALYAAKRAGRNCVASFDS